MIFTSEDLLKAMGLKEGDNVGFVGVDNIFTITKNDGVDFPSRFCLYCEDKDFSISITTLLDFQYSIIQPKPILTEDEKNFAQLAFNQGYRYLSKNKREKVASITKGNPIRCSDDTWFVESEFYFYLNMFTNLFQFIKWEDEPYSIEELLKE